MTGQATTRASASEATAARDEPTREPGAAGRPLGDISRALAQAAQVRPGTVRDLAQRAQVGHAAARYTASRMLARGQLVLVGSLPAARLGRAPKVLGVPACPDSGDDAAAADLQTLLACWTLPVR